jgi:hypothetical protein
MLPSQSLAAAYGEREERKAREREPDAGNICHGEPSTSFDGEEDGCAGGKVAMHVPAPGRKNGVRSLRRCYGRVVMKRKSGGCLSRTASGFMKVVIGANNTLAACYLVGAGAGVALVDPLSIAQTVPDLVQRPFRPRVAIHPRIVRSRHQPLSRLAASFMDDLRAVAALSDTLARAALLDASSKMC